MSVLSDSVDGFEFAWSALNLSPDSGCFGIQIRVRRSYSVRSEYVWSKYLFASKGIKWLYSHVSYRSKSWNFTCETNLAGSEFSFQAVFEGKFSEYFVKEPNVAKPNLKVHCLLLLPTVHCPLPTPYCQLFTAICTLFTVHFSLSTFQLSTNFCFYCPLFSTHCPLPPDHCPVSTAHCPLPIVHYQLPPVNCPLSTA